MARNGREEKPAAKLGPMIVPTYFYSDDSKGSDRIRALLKRVGIEFDEITGGTRVEWHPAPLVLHCGGYYEGLEEVEGLVRLLFFWQETRGGASVFADAQQELMG